MPHINYENKEIIFKLVYFGPGMSGKTTNLVHVHRTLNEKLRGEMVTLNTAEERTLFFDFFPVELGKIDGYTLRFNMYTVPGQVYYEACRLLILDGADGVVFVADSQSPRLEENLQSWRMMEDNLRYYEVDPDTFPLVLQYNKRDIPGAIEVGLLERELDLDGVPALEAVAIYGKGVMETVRQISRLIIERFQL